jgi:hypothetical protein
LNKKDSEIRHLNPFSSRIAVIKGIKYADTPCPKCEGKLRNRGYYWLCEGCGLRRGRSWKSDPFGRTMLEYQLKQINRIDAQSIAEKVAKSPYKLKRTLS